MLLADDSLTIQKVVELTFSDTDIELLALGSGDRAIEVLDEFRPDIVLADAVMPGRTGYEVCEAVKQRAWGKLTPVVLLTGTFEPFDRGRAERAGCDSIITKPFDAHAMAAQVRDLLQRAAQAKEKAASEPLPEPAFSAEADVFGESEVWGAPLVPELSAAELAPPPPEDPYATTALRIPSEEELRRLEEARGHASHAIFEPALPASELAFSAQPEAAGEAVLPDALFEEPSGIGETFTETVEHVFVPVEPTALPEEPAPELAAPEQLGERPPLESWAPEPPVTTDVFELRTGEVAPLVDAMSPLPGFETPTVELDLSGVGGSDDGSPLRDVTTAEIAPELEPPSVFAEAQSLVEGPRPTPESVDALFDDELDPMAEMRADIAEETGTSSLFDDAPAPLLPERSFLDEEVTDSIFVERTDDGATPVELASPIADASSVPADVPVEPAEEPIFSEAAPQFSERDEFSEGASAVAPEMPLEVPEPDFATPPADVPIPEEPTFAAAEPEALPDSAVVEDVFGVPDSVMPAVEPFDMPSVPMAVEEFASPEPVHGDIVQSIAAYERSMAAQEVPPAMPIAHEPAKPSADEAPEPPIPQELEALAASSTLTELIPGAMGASASAGPPAVTPAPAAAAPSNASASASGSGALTDGDVDRIARRVVELLSDRVVREIAWEVVPEMAERLVRTRLEELERG